ncbi:MAG TPA: serine/threonine-protein kinase [Phototrophicaceae bacterium]|nr:serine/threonine-protein kinase [Phototrophicaceae bacterium]
MMIQVGDQFDRFQIRSHLAQGGMADLYRAYDLMNSREVVIKVPNQMMLGDPAQYERFQRELEVTQELHHPAIQQGLGTGQFNRTPYLVTAFIDGKSMRDVITEQAPLPPERAVAIIRKIADGLAYCHDQEVIHRDLKPENVLITTDDQPVIIDFGLALTKGSHRVTYANLTPTAGTPDYMAPEQIEGQRGDQRTDLYAVGTMLFELLAGHTPFGGDNYQVIMTQHLRGALPRLDQEKPGVVSPQLAAVVARALQRHPDDRYPNMRAFIQDLDHLNAVDTSILERATGEQTAIPFWKSATFRTVVVTFLVMLAIVVLALALQGFAPK